MVTLTTLHPSKKVAAMGHHGARVAEGARHHSTVAAAILAARVPKKEARAKVEAKAVGKVDEAKTGIVETIPRTGQPSAVSELQHEDSRETDLARDLCGNTAGSSSMAQCGCRCNGPVNARGSGLVVMGLGLWDTHGLLPARHHHLPLRDDQVTSSQSLPV